MKKRKREAGTAYRRKGLDAAVVAILLATTTKAKERAKIKHHTFEETEENCSLIDIANYTRKSTRKKASVFFLLFIWRLGQRVGRSKAIEHLCAS